MSKERGLYYPNGHFKSAKELMNDAAQGDVKHLTPLPEEKAFDYYSDRFIERQKVMAETKDVPTNHVEIGLERTSALVFWGDQHIGSAETNYDRLQEELYRIVATPNMYVLMAGDTVDGFFWNAPMMESAEQVPAQYGYIRSMIKHLAKYNKLLVGFGGDHDGWAKKMGTNPIAQFTKDAGAHYINGVGYITMNVGKEQYKITGAHRLPGFSMYNNNHPQRRALNEAARGSDIIFSGHTHRKGISSMALKGFGGESERVHMHSIGPYKATDEYAQKLGFAAQTSEDMFGTAVILHADRKKIDDFYDIIEASNRLLEING